MNTKISFCLVTFLFAVTNVSAASNIDCATLNISAPKAEVDAVNVATFGAKPDDNADDTESLQAAFDSLKPSQTIVLAPGTYLQNKSLRIAVEGTTVIGEGATLHATNPDDQSLFINANAVSVYGITLTAITEGRRTGNRHHRLRASGDIHDILISRITIEPPSSVDASTNSSSGAGMYIGNVHRFVIANNTVSRTLADGIHITAGSSDGVVVGNKVRETGDDMIAVVSYLRSGGTGSPKNAVALSETYDFIASKRLVKNILIAHNDVAGNYWGRGISVVGGKDITIKQNTIHNIPIGAGAAILLAREKSFYTFGAENIIIEDNKIDSIHDASPKFTRKKNQTPPSDHGAIELHTALLDDELSHAGLIDLLGIKRILIRNNVIANTRTSGIRVSSNGVKDVGFIGNTLQTTKDDGIRLPTRLTDTPSMSCSANTLNGKKLNIAGCDSPSPNVVGASLQCDARAKVTVNNK